MSQGTPNLYYVIYGRPLNTIIFLWTLQEARDKKIRQRKDPMGEVANPPIWLRIKILHCTRVMLNHSGHMISHDDKTRPSNLVFLPNIWGVGADVCTWVCGGMCLLWDTQGFTMAGPLNIASDNQHQHPVIVSTASNSPSVSETQPKTLLYTSVSPSHNLTMLWKEKMVVLLWTGDTSVQ